MFDRDWYVGENPDAAAPEADPILHYLQVGAMAGRDPTPLFKGDWYLAQNPDVAAANVNPFVHYLETGAAEARQPHPAFDAHWYRKLEAKFPAAKTLSARLRLSRHKALIDRSGMFDREWYVKQNPDAAAHGTDPILHYLQVGAPAGRDPTPLFMGDWYLAQNPDLVAANANPFVHYLESGAAEAREPHPSFDAYWYRQLEGKYPAAKALSTPLRLARHKEVIERSGMFDRGWYVGQNPDAADPDPILHYLQVGATAGRDPSPLFKGDWYLAQYPDVAAANANPFVHYLESGAAEARQPHPAFDEHWYREREAEYPAAKTLSTPLRLLRHKGVIERSGMFDGDWYVRENPDAAADPILHYLQVGAPAGRDPTPLFMGDWYLAQNPDVVAGNGNPFVHYLESGAAEAREPHPAFDAHWYRQLEAKYPAAKILSTPLRLARHKGVIERSGMFDRDWYVRENPDAAADPILHYLQAGAAAGRDPTPLFMGDWYLAQNPDVAAANANPLVHYLESGAAEARQPHPAFDEHWYRQLEAECPAAKTVSTASRLSRHKGVIERSGAFDRAWYLKENPDAAAGGIDPILHYLQIGAPAGRDPSPLFKGDWYLAENPDVAATKANPFVHYLESGAAEARQPHPDFDHRWYRLAESKSASAAALALPLRRRHSPDYSLAELLTEQFGAACEARVRAYFDMLDVLHEQQPGSARRAETLAQYCNQLGLLSGQRNDSRSIDVSIVIPVFNQIQYTIACVRSVLEHRTRYRYEIIVGNDVSTDETAPVLESVGGVVKVITHPANARFVRNCNRSAQHAAGRYLVFLNNDTFVLDGWLDALLEPFAALDGVGLVGSKLLSSDGRLQEAGGIVWNDGSAWNFGRGEDPRRPQFNYLKDADYVSGASIALPLDVWNSVGGFDERYTPAYYEDADLAFALRANGLRTLFQPFSVVIHHEGVSHGRDVSAGLKSHQTVNRGKFFEKWRNVLEAKHFPNDTNVFLARDRSADRPHVLIVDHYLPEFDKDAGSRMMFQYTKMFVSAGFHVTFWPHDLKNRREYAQPLQSIGVEIVYEPYVGPRQFESWIKEHGRFFQYAFLSRAHIAERFVKLIKDYSDAKIMFWGVDLMVNALQRQFELSQDAKVKADLVEWQRLNAAVWSQSDVIYYPASDECAIVKQAFPSKAVRQLPVYVYSNEELSEARDSANQPTQAASALIFVGGFRHPPNADAIIWFCTEVLPLIRKTAPAVAVHVVGSYPGPEVEDLRKLDVNVTGYVSDERLAALYRSSSLSIAPLRFGGGVNGKIVEALRYGLPVVTTTVGLRGFEGGERFLKVADTPQAFAQAVVEVLRDQALRRNLLARAVDFLTDHHSQAAAARVLALDFPEFAGYADSIAARRSARRDRRLGENCG